MVYVLLLAGWLIYFAMHSILASNEVKNRVHLNPRVYRFIYVVLSTFGLFALLFFNAWIGGEDLIRESGIVTYTGLFLAAGGVILINAAFRHYSFRAFMGIREEKEDTLVTSGINAWVRHPLYSGTILITLGYLLFDPRLATLISVVCTWLYLWIGIRLEEKKLIRKFGDEYRNYRENVAAVVPFLL